MITVTQRLVLDALGHIEPATAGQLADRNLLAMTVGNVLGHLAVLEEEGMVMADSPPDSPDRRYTRTEPGGAGRRFLVAAPTEAQAPMPEWDLGSAEYVPMARWGKDHWTTFTYVEDHRGMLDHDQMRCDRRRHPVFYAAKRRTTAFGSDVDGARYPTRLKTAAPGADGRWGVVELVGHDDYDCLNDAIGAGLVQVAMPRLRPPHGDVFPDAWDRPVRIPDGDILVGDARPPRSPRGTFVNPSFVTGLTEMWLMTAASFSLTEQGQVIAGELRAHLAATRNSHQFIPSCPDGGWL